ncbi:hypothetical protein ACHAXR_006815 [Thalassiosira sp. AJA248-18]
MATPPPPPTPDLTAERRTKKSIDFNVGKASGNGTNGNGTHQKKKKHQGGGGSNNSKNNSRQKATSDNANGGVQSPSGNSVNGDHKHARDSNGNKATTSRPQKKQRSKYSKTTTMTSSSPSSSLAHKCLYMIVFALGTVFSLSLLFSTCAYIGCGTDNVHNMVDVALAKKSRGESTLDMLQQLKKSSAAGSSDNDSADEGDSSTLHESMCQVSSLAIGHFVHYLPNAQWLVLRNPFTSGVLEDDDESSELKKKEDKRRKGIVRRVLSKHKEKHLESTESTSPASEEIDRRHPLRHIIEGASIFSHHRKEKKMKKEEKKKMQKMKKKQQTGQKEDDEVEVDWKKWKYAMSDDYEIQSDQIGMIKELAKRVNEKANQLRVCKDDADCSDNEKDQIASLSEGLNMPYKPFQERLDAVAWGGINTDSTRWWQRKDTKDPKRISSQSAGGRLLMAYLKIMKWPKSMHVKYPFRLCAKGCDAEVSLLHTLEWREKYKPWCMSDASVQFNKAGFIYSRGHSRAGPRQRLEAEKAKDPSMLDNAGHSMVYYRPGLASPSDDPGLYGRSMINGLELAVADSLARNKGTIGRFNVVMDCKGMGSKQSPSIADVKKLFSVLQDHFPDRLGVLLAANLSGLTQMLMKMVLPFVTEDVRAKIHIIPNGEDERREMLLQFMDEEEIPYYLGGKDEYRFDPKEYYQGKCILPEDGIFGYVTSMPYHA